MQQKKKKQNYATSKQINFMKSNGIDFQQDVSSEFAFYKIRSFLRIKKESELKIKPSMAGLNGRLPASLKLTKFLTNKKIVISRNIKRQEAIELIFELGYSVDENDRIEKDE